MKEAFNPSGGRYIDYAVQWGVINLEAQEEATGTADEDYISRIHQITNGNIPPVNIATFEGGGFLTNGDWVVPPRDNEALNAEIGLIFDELSDSNGEFSTPQILTLTLPYLYSWIAFTVDFGLIPAVDFEIIYYAEDEEIYTENIEGNTGSVFIHEYGIENCDKVEIIINKILYPDTRARIIEVTFGTTRQYSKINSQEMDLTEEIDSFNERVPTNELNITVDNFSAEYSIFDPSGIYSYLQTRQPLRVKIGAQQDNNQMAYVDMGTYYLQAPELINNFSNMVLKATDLFGVLRETIYNKGIYKTATLAEFTDDICADAGVSVVYPADFENITLTTYIPSVSHTEALRRIAQASNTFLKVNRDDDIEFFRFDNLVKNSFSEDDYTQDNGLEPSDDSIINTIEFEVIKLSIGTEETLAEVTGTGIYNISYDPATDLIISGDVISSDLYCDNAIIEIDGTAEIKGKKIKENKSIITKTIANLGQTRLTEKISGSPFIQSTNGNSVAEHYLTLKAIKRRNMKMNYRGYPYLEMGEGVSFTHNINQTKTFIITKNALGLGGGMTGQLEAREYDVN